MRQEVPQKSLEREMGHISHQGTWVIQSLLEMGNSKPPNGNVEAVRIAFEILG